MGNPSGSRAFTQASYAAQGHNQSELRDKPPGHSESEPREQFGRVAREFSELVAPLLKPAELRTYEAFIHLGEGWARPIPLGRVALFTRLQTRTVRTATRQLERLGLIVQGTRGPSGAFQYLIVRNASPKAHGFGVIVRPGVYYRAQAIARGELPPCESSVNFQEHEAETAESKDTGAAVPPRPHADTTKPSRELRKSLPPAAPVVFDFAEGNDFDRAASEWARRGFSRAQLMQGVCKAREHLKGSRFEKAPVKWFADYFEYAARASDSYGAVFNRLAVAACSHRVFAWFESRVARAREMREQQVTRKPAQTEEDSFVPSASDLKAALSALYRA